MGFAARAPYASHDGEHPFKKVPAMFQQLRALAFVSPRSQQRPERNMRKLVFAAVAAMAIAAPTIASATEFGFRIGGDRDYCGDHYCGPRAGFYEHDRGWHRGWYHHDYDGDRGVVIHRYDYDD